LYEAFGYEKPVFCHVPLVIAEDGKKLSKRHGATSISEFKDLGYLPEALFNFLTFLGWAPSGGDNQEIFTRDELVKRFELHRVNRAKACFSYTKLNWMNGVYIRNLPPEELTKRLIPFWQKANLLSEPVPDEIYSKLIRVTELIQEKLKVLPDAIPMTEFVFKDLEIEDSKVLIGKKMTKEESLEALKKVRSKLSDIEDFKSSVIDTVMASLLTELNLNAGQLYSIVRWAVTGQKVSPHLAGSLEVAGKEKSLERIDKAINLLLK
jgi:glutamyl-tRNA synthetase